MLFKVICIDWKVFALLPFDLKQSPLNIDVPVWKDTHHNTSYHKVLGSLYRQTSQLATTDTTCK